MKKNNTFKRLLGKTKGSTRLLGKHKLQALQENVLSQNRQNQMSNKDRMYAHFAKQAYEHNKGIKEHTLFGYELVDDLSGEHHVVYTNKDKKHSIIAYKGTDPSQWQDIKSDMYIATGTEYNSPRFKNALYDYNSVKDKLNTPITVVGHSLGGAVANYVSDQTGAQSVTFNPGAGLGDLIQNRNSDRKRIIRTKYDPVSYLATLKQEGVVEAKQHKFDPHTIDNFTK